MTKNQSNKVYEYFDSCSRNLAPASLGHRADVLYAPFADEFEITIFCSAILADHELQRANRFVLEADQKRFIQRRAFRRYYGAKVTGITSPLSQVSFDETENGRPYLAETPDLWFSFSSCSCGFIGAHSSSHGIGVDLEDTTGNLEVVALARHFFSENEANTIEQLSEPYRIQVFLKLWCLKEAALKSIGEGLPFGLDAFQFELEPVLHLVQTPAEHGGPEKFSAHLVKDDNLCAALVLRNIT
jgi:phosphopantetheinyl transferase